jgi:hypothetical protein
VRSDEHADSAAANPIAPATRRHFFLKFKQHVNPTEKLKNGNPHRRSASIDVMRRGESPWRHETPSRFTRTGPKFRYAPSRAVRRR